MVVKLSEAARDDRLDSVETSVGTLPVFRIFTGGSPANCAAGDTGESLVNYPLPSDWMSAATGGAKAKTGTWSGSASGSGVAGHFRIYDTPGTTCHIQGNTSASGGGGDMELDNVNIAVSQTVTVNSFTLTDGNA